MSEFRVTRCKYSEPPKVAEDMTGKQGHYFNAANIDEVISCITARFPDECLYIEYGWRNRSETYYRCYHYCPNGMLFQMFVDRFELLKSEDIKLPLLPQPTKVISSY